MSDKTAVYRLYDEGGLLLYVGISNNPWRRFAEHRAEKSWSNDVTDFHLEWFPSRRVALIEEQHAIADEAPLHNRARPAAHATPYLPPIGGGWFWAAQLIYADCPRCAPDKGFLSVGVHSDQNGWVLDVECDLCGHGYVDRTEDSDVVIDAGRLGQGWRPQLVPSG